MYWRTQREPDIESGPEVDFDEPSWPIDLHRPHLIEKISKPNTGTRGLLRRLGVGRSLRSTEAVVSTSKDSEGNNQPRAGNLNNRPSDGSEGSYFINLTELQRLRLRQLQCKLVNHVVDITYGLEPSEWANDLREYGKSKYQSLPTTSSVL